MIPRGRLVRVVLGAIVVIALAVRLWGLTFGLPIVSARPDELLIVVTALRFFADGNLHPRFFDYPGLFLYLVGGIYLVFYALGRALGWFESIPHFVGGTHGRWPTLYILNRFASAIFGTLTTIWLYRAGRALFGDATGLMSALFLALAFLHVRDSHYGTTDAALTFFTVCAIHALAQLQLERRRGHAVKASILAGLAMGTKYNSVLLVAPMAVVELQHVLSLRGRGWWERLRTSYLPWMIPLMIATFLATSPYLIIDYPKALRDLAVLGKSMEGGMTGDLLGPGWIYHLRFSLPHGIGWPMLAAAFAGAGLMIRRHTRAAIFLLSYPALYYVVAGASANVFVRYMMPMVPFLCLFAAYFVQASAGWIAARLRMREAAVAAIAALAIVAPSAWSVIRFDHILSQRDNRLVAGDWIHQNVPYGSTVFMTGNSYGFPPLEDRANPKWRLLRWDWVGIGFIENEHPFAGWPDWIVVQRSALPYSHIPPEVEAALPKHYALAQTIRAGDVTHPANVYDIQDGFYMPYGGFRNIHRPGPNFEIYQRRPEFAADLTPISVP